MKKLIRKFKIDSRIRIGYGTAFFLLLICYLLTLYTNRQLLEQADWVDHSNKVIHYLENLLSNVKDGETGLLGYLVTKDQHFLDSYYTSKTSVDAAFSQIRQETKYSPLQYERLDTLNTLIKRKFDIIQSGVHSFMENNFQVSDSLTKPTYRGKEIMDQIRTLVLRMQIREEQLLQERKEKMRARFNALNTIIVVSLVIAFLLLTFGFITYITENKARRIADEKVSEYQAQLKRRINELAKANIELRLMRSLEKFAATGRIARTIAHEVRNPLTNITLAVDQLRNDIGVSADGNSVLFEMVNRNSMRINQLISDLLNSTKFSELKYSRVSINELMEGTLELAKDRIALSNIQVEKNHSSVVCEVSVDDEKIKIALLNIILNAVEAMEPGKGILKISTRAEMGKCTVEIADNGTGMDKESLSRLFEPYFSNKAKGNGLGLTNTQNIILNHGGTISVESEPGKGTTFTITLDLAK